MPRVAVVGASTNRSKFGNISLRAHIRQGWTVYPIHPTESLIEDLPVFSALSEVPEHLNRISVYLPPPKTLKLLDEICTIPHEELWLNPGSEDAEVLEKARQLNLVPILACSIVDIGENPASFQ